MIHDNALSDRLNAVKYGEPIPQPVLQPQHPIEQKQVNENKEEAQPKNSFFDKLVLIVDNIVVSFLYGYALKTLFDTDWTILGALTVGFLLNHIISVFPKTLFPKYFK